MSRRYYIFLSINLCSIVESIDSSDLGPIKTCVFVVLTIITGQIGLVNCGKDSCILTNPHRNQKCTTSRLVLEQFDKLLIRILLIN